MTKNNVMAIILSAFVICMTSSSYCWVFVSYIRYFEFRDLIVSSVVGLTGICEILAKTEESF